MTVATRPPKAYVLASVCLFTLMLLPQISLAKNCTSSDITLADQGDVNLFQQAFSGGGTCDTITGTLRIEDGGGTNITDLTPLRDLRYVNGNLIVYGNYELATADGLEGIQRVGGDLDVSYNDELGDCSALYELLDATPTTRVGVGGEIYIAYNAAGCNSRTEVVETVKYNWEICPAYAFDEVASSYGDELPVYELRHQSDVEELRAIVGTQCNALPGLLKIGQDWELGPSDITDLSSLSWIRNVWDLWIFNSPAISSESVNEGLGNLEGSINAIYIDWLGILDLDFLANLTEFKTKSYYWNPGAYIYATPLSSLGPLSSLETPSDLTFFGWYISYNAWLSDCQWPGDPVWDRIRVEQNAPGCNTPEEVIANWNKPRHRLSMSSSPGGAINYHNLSVSNDATSGYGWYTRNTQEMLSVGVPEGLNFNFSPSPNSPYEFSDFLSNCNGGTRSSTREFILSSMEDDCYLHVNYSRGPSDPSTVAGSKTLSGSSCRVIQPALEPKVEWREQGLLNVSDQAVEVICPLPRKSYLGRDQQYFSNRTAVAIAFSVDAVSTAHTDCALVAGESVGDFVAPATSNFRLHGWATDTGEITIRPESYPAPSTADVLSYHAIKCTLQPGVGISSLRIDSLK